MKNSAQFRCTVGVRNGRKYVLGVMWKNIRNPCPVPWNPMKARVRINSLDTKDIKTEKTQALQSKIPTEKRSISRKEEYSGVSSRYRLFLQEWDKGFMDATPCPDGYEPEVIFGEIPKDIYGTLYRNGPGKFQIGDDKVEHPYDADGIIASIAFRDGCAYFRSRFVETREYLAEKQEEKVLFRGTFATQRSGGAIKNIGDLWVKNVSNTNVVAVSDKVLSLFEAGQP